MLRPAAATVDNTSPKAAGSLPTRTAISISLRAFAILPKPESQHTPLTRIFNQNFTQTLRRCGIRLQRKARAHQMTIAIRIIDAADCRPEFVFACPRRGKGRLLARIRPVPFLRRDRQGGVRRILTISWMYIRL